MPHRRTKTRDFASREERRKEALARNEAWAAFSPQEKRMSLYQRRGKSEKQLARLGA